MLLLLEWRLLAILMVGLDESAVRRLQVTTALATDAFGRVEQPASGRGARVVHGTRLLLTQGVRGHDRVELGELGEVGEIHAVVVVAAGGGAV